MVIKPIRTETDYEAAVRAIDELWSAPLGSPDADVLDVLVTLVTAYEENRHPIALPDPISAILFRMEQLDLSRKDLEQYLGSRSRVSEILNRTRCLSISMIRNLHQGLKIPIEVLIQEQQLPKKPNRRKYKKAPRQAA